MAAPDLTAQDNDRALLWKQAIASPARHYARPWVEEKEEKEETEEEKEDTEEKEEETKEKEEREGREENQPTHDPPHSLVALRQQRTRSRLYEGSFFDDPKRAPPPHVVFEGEPSATASFYAASRVPKMGEKVEISYVPGTSYFPLIVGLTDESNAVQLEPLSNVMGNNNNDNDDNNGNNNGNVWLGLRELVWHPHGYWRHSSALAMASVKRKTTTTAQRFKLFRNDNKNPHRVNHVNNTAIPASLAATFTGQVRWWLMVWATICFELMEVFLIWKYLFFFLILLETIIIFFFFGQLFLFFSWTIVLFFFFMPTKERT
jgi:hypothetical protein